VALAGGLGLGGGREEGESGREVRGFDPPLDFGKESPRGGVRRPWPSRRAAAMGSVSRGGQGRVLGRKREREGPGTNLGPWLEQGGGGAGRPQEAGAAAEQACGSGDAAQRRRARGGGGGCGSGEAAWGPLSRPSKVVGRAVGRWPRCGRPASFAGAINGVWPLASIAERRASGEADSGQQDGSGRRTWGRAGHYA